MEISEFIKLVERTSGILHSASTHTCELFPLSVAQQLAQAAGKLRFCEYNSSRVGVVFFGQNFPFVNSAAVEQVTVSRT